MSGSRRQAGRGVRKKLRDRLLLVQNDAGRGALDRGRSRPQVVDRALSTAQLDRRLLHRDEGNTVLGKGKGTRGDPFASFFSSRVCFLEPPTPLLPPAAVVPSQKF